MRFALPAFVRNCRCWLPLLAAAVALAGALAPVSALAQRKKPLRVSAAGQQLFNQGHYAEAEVEINALLRQDSLNQDLRYNRAMCELLRPGEYHARQALTDFDALLQRQSQNPVLLAQRGFVHFRLGQTPAALTDLDQALLLRPRQPELLQLRGLVRLYANEPLAGLTELAQANSLAPRNPDCLFGLAWGQLLNGREAEAQRSSARLLKLAPAYPQGHSLAALLALRQADPATARRRTDEALRLAPTDFDARLLSAFLYQQAGDETRAQPLYAALQPEMGDPCSLTLERADLHYLAGNQAAATAAWQQAAQAGSGAAASRLATPLPPLPLLPVVPTAPAAPAK